MNDDLCSASQAAKHAQVPLLKQTKAKGEIAFFRHIKLIVREKYNDDSAAAAGQAQRPAEEAGVVGAAATGGVVGVKSRPAAADDMLSMHVEVAGVWCGGRVEALPSLNLLHSDNSRTHSSSTPVAKQIPVSVIGINTF